MKKTITYIVKPFDTLWKIANQFHTSVQQLMELNELSSTQLSVGQTLLIQKEEGEQKISFENDEEFLKQNLGTGILKVQTRIGNTYLPIQHAKIEVYRYFGNQRKVFFQGYTGPDGFIDHIALPSPSRRKDYLNGASLYQIQATHPRFQDTNIEEVSIYDGIKSIQIIEMLPQQYISLKGNNNGN